MPGMDDHDGQVTRLGPDSGGHGPGEPTVRVYSWEWGPGAGRRPGLPWIGIFLLVFGGLLLIQQLFPEARALGSLLFVAIGLAFLVKWAIDRGTGSLYAGAIITALAAPGLIEAATNATYDGLGTLCSGSRSCSSRWSVPPRPAGSAGRPGSAACWRSSAWPRW